MDTTSLSAPSVGLGIFLATQLMAAVWWASETDVKVEENREAIISVSQNSRDIAVIQNEIMSIKNSVKKTEENLNEVKGMMQQILFNYKKTSLEQ